MKKENAIATIQTELSLPDLQRRIEDREKQIDLTCKTTLAHAANAVQLAIDQGNDLILVKSKVKHGDWLDWLNENFSKSTRLAQDYMRLAEISNTQRAAFLENPKSIRDAFRLLGLLPENPPGESNSSAPSISIAPIFSRLNFIAEYVVKSRDEINTWEPARREEFKIQLKPVVELYQSL